MAFLNTISSLFAQQTVQAIAAGLLTGVVGGTALVASGIVPTGGTQASAQTVDLLGCPGAGPVLAKVANGEALLVTARSADGTWFEVYVGQPGVDRGWAPATALQVDSEADALPVADCSLPGPAPQPAPTATAVVVTPSPEPTAPPTLAPNATPSPTPRVTPRVTPSPTPRITPRPTPTKPPPTKTPPPPTPTPFVDDTPPSVAHPWTTGDYDSTSGKWFIFSPGAQCTPPFATITTRATDPDDAVAGVTLYYKPWGYASYFTKAMTPGGSNTWSATITTDQGFVWNDQDLQNQIYYWVNAVDSHGNHSADVYPTVSYLLYKGGCIL